MVEPFSRETPLSGANDPDLSSPINPSRELPIASDTTADYSGIETGSEQSGEQPIVEVAERIGEALGTAVNRVRRLEGQVRTRLRVIEGQGRARVRSATETAQETAQSVSGRISEVSRQAGANASRWREQVTESASERLGGWRESVEGSVADLRRRTEQIRQYSPLQALAAVAAVSLVIGAGLRMPTASTAAKRI
jgi:ElaB/YqjD/DUF883 family membrane-anchored ribosome-binding protein